MKPAQIICLVILGWLGLTGCSPGWKSTGGSQRLPPIYGPGNMPAEQMDSPRNGGDDPSLGLSLTLPRDWSWFMRGNDFIATGDGVFLQHIRIERIHMDQAGQSAVESPGFFPYAAYSTKLWPVRAAGRYAKEQFTVGMSATDAARIVLESRRNNPGITGFVPGEILPADIAGKPGFRTTYEFRVPIARRSTPYRTIYCGFIHGNWFYGLSYTAASRYYFDRDQPAFEAALKSLRAEEE